MKTIRVNGREVSGTWDSLEYADVVELAGFDPERVLSVTYDKRVDSDTRRAGILTIGKVVRDVDGMIFNVADTSNA